jgi:beta-phosphoglucomutase-like phosphatase (HAD superfamily)
VILDVDGTLVDSNDGHARSWVQAFAEHGITVAYEEVRRAIGMGGDKLMPRIRHHGRIGRRAAHLVASRGGFRAGLAAGPAPVPVHARAAPAFS